MNQVDHTTVNESSERIQKKDTESSRVTLQQAQNYCDRGWLNEAIEVFDELINENGDDPIILLEYGNTLFKKGDLSSAEHIFEKLTIPLFFSNLILLTKFLPTAMMIRFAKQILFNQIVVPLWRPRKDRNQ